MIKNGFAVYDSILFLCTVFDNIGRDINDWDKC